MENLKVWILLSIFFIYCVGIKSQDNQVCSRASRCGDCVVRATQCVWCRQENFNGTDRCATTAIFQSEGSCANEFITRAPANGMTTIRDDALSDGDEKTSAVQLKPQHIRVKLKPNSAEQAVIIEYRVAKNFPVDLYFLSDPSYTMRTLKENLVRLAGDIAEAIGNLTTNFLLGFGASMEKVTMPFTHITKKYLENPCHEQNEDCESPYSFKHRMKLTRNISNFIQQVDKTRLTANYDAPEGMFDGLMQALTCTEQIGWRNISRRLLIFTTDADFHYAGDGRLAGIVEPNDGKCHMNDDWEYTMSLKQDYPSVGQIAEMARESDTTIIFAVSAGVKNVYKKLTQEVGSPFYIPGAVVEELKADSSNIKDITIETYKKTRQSVSLKYEGLQHVEIDTLSTCGRINGDSITNFVSRRQKDRRTSCGNITIGQTIEFELSMTLKITECPKDRSEWKERIIINPEGLKEQVVVDVEYICECDCQEPGQAEVNSERCNNGSGTFECGVCHCNDGWTGKTCDCDNTRTELEACSPGNDNNTDSEGIICSNRGTCRCGKCDCVEGFTGEFCQCNDRECGRSDGKLCGGNGDCVCGTCQCYEGYTKSDCSCLESMAACQTANGTMCSGHGECVCGECQCEDGYRGATCAECKICKLGCGSNKACAECMAFNEGDYSREECLRQCDHVEVTEDDLATGDNITQCSFSDSKGCFMDFTFEIIEDQLKPKVVVVGSKLRCPPPPADILPIAIGIPVAVFLVALILLLLWRLFAWFYDGVEYSKFETEIKNPKWGFDENPIYRGCVTTVANPKYDANM